ncbi:MAG: class I SAM-dependent methyltransferase [Anaerolineae bacterium]|nr:class I SAM-dependent methyltransferase [Anaerolineae bacterium]
MPANETMDYYNAVAEEYEYFYRDWEAAMQRDGADLRRLFKDRQVAIKRVLDASCGTGTQSIALAKLGYEVTAMDPSRNMLHKARQNALKYNVGDKISIGRANFLNLPRAVTGPFDAVITKGNSLPHLLQDDQLQAAISNFYNLLRPGGLVVIGIRDYDFMMEDRARFVPRQYHEGDGDEKDYILFDVWDWDDGPPVTVTFNTFIVSGKDKQYQVNKQSVKYRALKQEELEKMMKQAGFIDLKVETQHWELVATAIKPAAEG